MKYRVRHRTVYQYSEPVSLGHNQVLAVPRTSHRQTCLSSHLDIEPVPAVLDRRRDYFGNWVIFFTIQERHEELSVTMRADVEVEPSPVPDQTPPWETVAEELRAARTAEGLDAYQFAFESTFVKLEPELADYARESFPKGRPVLEAARELCHRINKDFKYDPEATDVSTPLKEVLEKRRGVCQDFAHLQLGGLRSLGLAARYVSGYLLTVPPPGQPKLVGADASHAWVSLFLPGSGWIDLDPTNDVICQDQHIVQAWGRDYEDVAPVRGVVLGGGEHTVTVSVDVTPEG